MLDGTKPPLVLNATTESVRLTSGLSHAGQATAVPPDWTKRSKSFPQAAQRYS